MIKTKVLEQYTDKIKELFEKYDNIATEDVEDVKTLCDDVKRVGMLLTRRETKPSVRIPKPLQDVLAKKASREQPVQTPRRNERHTQNSSEVIVQVPHSTGSSSSSTNGDESYHEGEESPSSGSGEGNPGEEDEGSGVVAAVEASADAEVDVDVLEEDEA